MRGPRRNKLIETWLHRMNLTENNVEAEFLERTETFELFLASVSLNFPITAASGKFEVVLERPHVCNV